LWMEWSDRAMERTITNKLDWRAQEISAEFYVEVGENVVAVEQEMYTKNFVLKIYDGAYGELIGSTKPDIFADDKVMIPKLAKLYELAKRKAMNAGEKIKLILNILMEMPDNED